MTNSLSFFKHVFADNTVEQELTDALEGKQGEEALRAICEVAANHGFNLTMEETAAAVSELIRANNEDQELTDNQLESVAGGSSAFKSAFLRALGGSMDTSKLIRFAW